VGQGEVNWLSRLDRQTDGPHLHFDMTSCDTLGDPLRFLPRAHEPTWPTGVQRFSPRFGAWLTRPRLEKN
jgi:hypothetical protein